MRCCMRSEAVEAVKGALAKVANGDPSLSAATERIQAQLEAWMVERMRADAAQRQRRRLGEDEQPENEESRV